MCEYFRSKVEWMDMQINQHVMQANFDCRELNWTLAVSISYWHNHDFKATLNNTMLFCGVVCFWARTIALVNFHIPSDVSGVACFPSAWPTSFQRLTVFEVWQYSDSESFYLLPKVVHSPNGPAPWRILSSNICPKYTNHLLHQWLWTFGPPDFWDQLQSEEL